MPNSVPVVFLACKVFEGILGGGDKVTANFLDYGLHSVPKQLNQTVREQLKAIAEPSLVILGYGLCGNGLHEIEAGIHTLIIPKADDCVAIFMGSRQRYLEEFEGNSATYYLTKGWFEVGSDPLSEYEKLVTKYETETANWVMEQQYQHYKRLLFVAHCQEDLVAYRPRALEVAAYCERFGMVYEEYLGNGNFINQIASVIESQKKPTSEFIIIPPGGTLRQELFR